MKYAFAIVLAFCALQGWSQTNNQIENFRLSREILKTNLEPFIPHRGEGYYDSYLSMELPFSPMAELFKQLLVTKKTQLASRGEAHITVLTPVEYQVHFKPLNITMDQIDTIARELNIQSAKFDVICLGMGEAMKGNKLEKTYYVVVESDDLLKIRKRLRNLYIKSGGKGDFSAFKWYPHITLGFSKEDLHESDGVYKDAYSCQHEITLD